jgi:hypothetical protein
MKKTIVLATFLSLACIPSFAQDPDKDKPPKPPQEQPDKSKPQPKPEERKPDDRKPDDRKQQEPPPKPDDRRQQPPQKPEERKPEDRKQQEPPSKPEERRQQQQPNERPQPNRQEPDRSQPERQQANRQEARGNHPAPPPPRRDAREARNSRRIPDDRYRAEFGRDHHFRVRFENDQPRFVYAGYSFEYAEPWPVDWDYYDDDFYIVYEDDYYYLYDLDRPRVRILLILVG